MWFLLSQQEELLLVGRKALSTLRERRNKEFGQGHAAGQWQEQRERSGLPLPSDTADEPLPPRRIRLRVREGRLTLTPREVQPL